MGDVIHALPVVTDIAAARPDVQVDWVVEEAFADLPRLHPAVREVVPVAVRRWRRAPFARANWSELQNVRRRLRAGGYDLALDLQGLLKSALIARWAGAPIAGFSRACVREPMVARFYDRPYAVDMGAHAIERLRSLAAQALGYRVLGLPRFGLAAPAVPLPWCPPPPYVVCLHATSRAEKLWPREAWTALGRTLLARGVALVLPWGGEAERGAAQAIATAIAPDATDAPDAPGELPPVIVAPRLSLGECARLLADATAVVGVDTGLMHLAAALDTPTVALFAATSAARFGPYWTPRAKSLGEGGRWPTAAEVLQALAELGVPLGGRP